MKILHTTIVGSGVAGLFTALELLQNQNSHVTIVSKDVLEQSNTYYAQGGIAAVLSKKQKSFHDSSKIHIEDTLRCGSYWNDSANVATMCNNAAQIIETLEKIAITFDTHPNKQPKLGLEGGHSFPRILHSGGDKIGVNLVTGLLKNLQTFPNNKRVNFLEKCMATHINQDPKTNAATGITYLNTKTNTSHTIKSDNIVIATGGAGQLFSRTTNPQIATADGIVLAKKAGAELTDLEFFQFHPTVTTDNEPFMISEAVRGEGAILTDSNGKRFMQKYHKLAELAPRDIVSRAILTETKKLQHTNIFLDTKPITQKHGTNFLKKRFPTIHAQLQKRQYNWETQPIPITPAAHYWMGGIKTNSHSQTSVAKLYAVGEVACNKTQGANRLASNSLLEALVFAQRCAQHINEQNLPTFKTQTTKPNKTFPTQQTTKNLPFTRNQLQKLMFKNVGLERNQTKLTQTITQLQIWHKEFPENNKLNKTVLENNNLIQAALLLTQAALNNPNSLGSHYRTDTNITQIHKTKI